MVYNISGVFAHSHTCYMKERMTPLICDLQKASMWKRISAALFDGILLSIAAVLFAWLLSVIVQYDTPAAVLNESYAKYEEAFGVDFDITAAAYEAMSPEEKANLDAAYDALASDDDAVYAYNMMMQLTLLIHARKRAKRHLQHLRSSLPGRRNKSSPNGTRTRRLRTFSGSTR